VSSPFLVETKKPLVAIRGERGGYVQLAPSREITNYADLPEGLFFAARAWAVELEKLGAKRVYWITLSEVVRHLHVHLYPRWSDDEARGIALFEQRESEPQPEWTDALRKACHAWAEDCQVHLI